MIFSVRRTWRDRATKTETRTGRTTSCSYQRDSGGMPYGGSIIEADNKYRLGKALRYCHLAQFCSVQVN